MNTIESTNQNSNCIPYLPISKKGDESTYINKNIYLAQQEAKKNLPQNILSNWDNWVAEKLSFTIEELFNSFSAEQIDSIGLGIFNFEKNKQFLVADETGVGKGRILAGLSRYCLLNKKKVLFFTEREHLHSEFWKDLNDINSISLLINPVLYHSTATIYDQNNKPIFKGNIKAIKEYSDNGLPEDTNFIFTNYSQISLKEHTKAKKNVLLNFIIESGALIVLDECHNATGDSNTKQFILNLIKQSKRKIEQSKGKTAQSNSNINVVFSSATFIKDETQLELYNGLFEFPEEITQLLKRILSNPYYNSYQLRESLIIELTKHGKLWRREHEPLDVTWKNITCSNIAEIDQYIELFSEFTKKLFFLNNHIFKYIQDNKINKADTKKYSKNWGLFGASINRYAKNLLFILKIKEVAESIEQSLNRKHKPVIVIDSTLFSLINDVKEYNTTQETDDNQKKYNFAQALKSLVHKTIGNTISNLKPTDNSIYAEYQKLILETHNFNELILSPIDTLFHILQEKNITIGEVSGRTHTLDIDKQLIVKRKSSSKFQTVSDFNNNRLQAILLTRAGASGISLQSSAKFINQEVRELFEVDITTRPNYRIQFLGRVNRKNQVNKPDYFAITTHLPFEQRILNKEDIKLTKIQTHISGETEKLKQYHIINLYTPYIDYQAYLFFKNNPNISQQCGIVLGEAYFNKDPFYYIDSLLKRSIAVDPVTINKYFDYIKYCTEMEKLLHQNEYEETGFVIENSKNYYSNMNQSQKLKFQHTFEKNKQASLSQFEFLQTYLLSVKQGYVIQENNISKLKSELKYNRENSTHFSEEDCKQIIDKLIYSNKYNQSYIKQHIKPLLNNLTIGKQISFFPDYIDFYENIAGYINNIYAYKNNDQNIDLNFSSPESIIIEIVTINPVKNDKYTYPNQKVYLKLSDLVDNENVKLSNKPIDWNIYERKNDKYVRTKMALAGNPVLIEFFKQSYKFGTLKEKRKNDTSFMMYIFPDNFTEESIKKLPQPILNPFEIVTVFANDNAYLSSIWQDSDDLKDGILLEQKLINKKPYYHLKVALEIKKQLIDYPMHAFLNEYYLEYKNGYAIYQVPHKQIFKLIYMLMARQVVLFKKYK